MPAKGIGPIKPLPEDDLRARPPEVARAVRAGSRHRIATVPLKWGLRAQFDHSMRSSAPARQNIVADEEIEMTLCPVALTAGCKKCPAVQFCMVKTIIGDYEKPGESETKPDSEKAKTGQ
jgi:hypothetical protein